MLPSSLARLLGCSKPSKQNLFLHDRSLRFAKKTEFGFFLPSTDQHLLILALFGQSPKGIDLDDLGGGRLL
jgi:hypothetical protein